MHKCSVWLPPLLPLHAEMHRCSVTLAPYSTHILRKSALTCTGIAPERPPLVQLTCTRAVFAIDMHNVSIKSSTVPSFPACLHKWHAQA